MQDEWRCNLDWVPAASLNLLYPAPTLGWDSPTHASSLPKPDLCSLLSRADFILSFMA